MKAVKIPAHLALEVSRLPKDTQISFVKVLEAQRIMIKCPTHRKTLFSQMEEIQSHYLTALEASKELSLSNLSKYLGRRYNMFINVPQDYERFNGRDYDIILG